MSFTDQSDYDVRFEQGEQGLAALAASGVSCFVIVDVLSFSTCASSCVPLLQDGCFRPAPGSTR